MKNIILMTCFVLSGFYSNAQSFQVEHDHSTIQVKNIEQSADFYKNIIHLKEVGTPWPENKMIRFFETGKNQQLHIAQVNEYGEVKVNKVLHIAFSIKDFDGYLNFLNKEGIKFSNFNGEYKKIEKRPDGARQIYLVDPDGYWVEINDVMH